MDRAASSGAASVADGRKRTAASGLRRRAAIEHRILVVEDDHVVAAMLECILAMEGFGVSVVGDGSRALAALHSSTFHALIVDVKLPGLDGLEIVRAVRAHPRIAEMAVVILTGNADERSTWEGWRAGCDCYLTKPFDPSQLISLLKRLVGSATGGGR